MRSERGAELIELALVLPILLLVIAGIVDFGLLMQRYLTINNAAREGARIAVLPGYGLTDVQNRVTLFVSEGTDSISLAGRPYSRRSRSIRRDLRRHFLRRR